MPPEVELDEASPAVSNQSAQWQLLVVAFALLLPVLFDENLYAPFWAPKAALVLVIAGPGLVMAVRLAAAGDRSARVGLGLIVLATVSTVLANQPLLATVGLFNWGTGLIFIVALVGVWALGTQLTSHRRRQIELALI